MEETPLDTDATTSSLDLKPDALKPCPFCGAKARITERPRGSRVECADRHSGCTMNGRTHHHRNTIDAIKAWNTRAPKSQAVKTVEVEGQKLIRALTDIKDSLAQTLDDDFAFWSSPQNAKYRTIVYGAYKSLRAIVPPGSIKPELCIECGVNLADPPSEFCPGCKAYKEHQR